MRIVNFLNEFIWALYCFLDFTERDLYWWMQIVNIPSKLAPILCKHTCICKYQHVSDQLIQKCQKMYQISKNINRFPYYTTNLYWYNAGPRRGPALSIQIVNFLIEFVRALYCFLHFTEFSQKYPCQNQCKPFLKCQQTWIQVPLKLG